MLSSELSTNAKSLLSTALDNLPPSVVIRTRNFDEIPDNIRQLQQRSMDLPVSDPDLYSLALYHPFRSDV